MESKSEPRAKGKIELISLLILDRARDRNAEIQTKWCTGNKEPQAKAKVIVIGCRIEIVSPLVNEARVVKYRKTDRADDID